MPPINLLQVVYHFLKLMITSLFFIAPLQQQHGSLASRTAENAALLRKNFNHKKQLV
jgi:hypothetical protein